MGYYVKSDYSGYYESSVAEEVTDISVTQRPHVICEWDGAAWTYPLAAAQAFQKKKVTTAMKANLDSLLFSFYAGYYEVLMLSIGMVEATAFEDDTLRAASTVPFLEAYRVERAHATLQDAADEIQTDFGTAHENLGKAFARRATIFGVIDAETVGLTCLTHNWTDLT